MDTQDWGTPDVDPIITGLAIKTSSIVQLFAYMLPDADRSKVDFNSISEALKIVDAAICRPCEGELSEKLSAILKVLDAYYSWRTVT